METWREEFANTPPFAHLAPWLGDLQSPDWPTLATLNALAERRNLRNATGLSLRFAPQTRRCGQRDYEFGIYASGQVPSRERNWHDLFNALIWLTFPATKAALNAVHQAALPQGANRTPASDAATVFDESGLVLVGEDESLAELLATRRWQEAFVLRRGDWPQVRAYIVGHAVLEKLLTPWPGITAKSLFLKLPAETPPELIDAAIAQRWQSTATPVPSALFPVPVLGIPGWWPANEQADFYADEKVFRRPLPG